MNLRATVLAAGAVLLVCLAALGQLSKRAPSNLLVEVSVRPHSASGPILVPGDRTDKPAFVAEIWLHHPPTGVAYAHKRVVVFPDEPAKGTFPAADLSVDYTVSLDSKQHRVEAKVNAHRGQEFVCGSSSEIWLSEPKAALQQVPGK